MKFFKIFAEELQEMIIYLFMQKMHYYNFGSLFSQVVADFQIKVCVK